MKPEENMKLEEKIRPQLSHTAFDRIARWLHAPHFSEESKQQIRALLSTDPSHLEDAFYTTLEFGTGGMRGVMGVGTNRMNIYTIRLATFALCQYMQKTSQASVQASVVIGYDSRNNSQLFAEEAAKVIAAQNMQVYLFDALRPTPMISFACRYFKAGAAIMITASHNPPEYNGYKVYWSDGGQVVAPHDGGIIQEFRSLEVDTVVPTVEIASDKIQRINVDQPYLDALPKPINQIPISIDVIYTSLHGTGSTIMREALAEFGVYKCTYVPLQTIPDGNFPTVKKPNPEEPQALELGIKTLEEMKGDILIATDPDADRMGVVVRNRGPVILNGNQIFVLMVEYILRTRRSLQQGVNSLPKNGSVGTVYVGTPLIEAICRKYGVHVTTVLPGFKYFAEKIRQWEATGEHTFIIGGEESYGTLYGTYTRDKDAIAAARLISEITAQAKLQGSNLYQELRRIWEEFGYFKEELFTLTFSETKEGREEMERVLEKVRHFPPTKIAGLRVITIDDLLKTEVSQRLDLPRSNVLGFYLEEGNKVIIRPSGTEPKVKIYLMANNRSESECDQILIRLKEGVEKEILK